MNEDFELMKARLMLIKYYMAVSEARVSTGEFGDINSSVREERWKAGRALNNFVGAYTYQVLKLDFIELYEAVESALSTAEDGRYGLSRAFESELRELYDWFRERLPDGYFPSWLKHGSPDGL
ncbi:hypothetical protein LRN96_000020 [Escherichia coli]|uniref:hypothetical protein n=1 Tax=Escherichia coli TaxID=562 RepID=UPI0005112669|nr:hypothetical protein [Escherichia coli]EFF0242906.1 hypothetical protein [Escherichia coli]EGL3007697.1 hypothetical protein [Escherichia coli]EGL6014764.1 hypothetical protein [Escherichia coli]EHX5757782.1 hypothetical protein [Escherichia coli]EIP0506099.1 hypothetical protein [Escherichia coli]